MDRSHPVQLIDEEALFQSLQMTVPPKEESGKTQKQDHVLAILKTSLQKAHKQAENMLASDGNGTLCAIRLSYIQDSLLRILFKLAKNHIFKNSKDQPTQTLAVAAVGGYGRGTLAPYSDIDLLFILPDKHSPSDEAIVEYILYKLWDLSFKVGHATRNVATCIKLARNDVVIRTSLLEARLVCGHEALFKTLTNRFFSDIVRHTIPQFITAKLEERDIRHKRSGESRYRVEPNIKEGKGGLRDLHTLYWIAKYAYALKNSSDFAKSGILTRKDYNLFKKCEEFLWTVRCHLHFLTHRVEECLSFDVQSEIAQRLGYTAHGGLKAVERFMKHYFLVAKDVGDLTRILCAQLEEANAKTTPGLNRFLFNLANMRRKKLRGTQDFILETGRLAVANSQIFEKNPVNIIRFFWLADHHNIAFHPDSLQLIRQSQKHINTHLRNEPEANRLFLEILSSRHQPETVLRTMNETGVLGRFIPDFGKIVSMMQFNMYHHYTVDEHLIRSIGILSHIEQGQLAEEHPLANKIFPEIKDRLVLYVALLLHDIAKGRREDHSIAGEKVARKLCPRFGLNSIQTERVAWLVKEHLTMSKIAQSRDLTDRKTIEDFANIVQTPERLKLLLVLTICDIKAVGPGVWNGWKGQLLRTLYYETEPLLTGGFTKSARKERVDNAKQALTKALASNDKAELQSIFWNTRKLNAYKRLHYSAYWLRVDLDTQIRHAHFIADVEQQALPLATSVQTKAFEGVTEITIYAPDHPRLLSYIAGACAIAGANIVDAQIFTTTSGKALDTIFIKREFEEDVDEIRRSVRIGELIEEALTGMIHLPHKLAQSVQREPRKTAFRLTPRVTINNDLSNVFSVLEVSGLDRTGLLYELTLAIADLQLDIASAHIATFGERAVDGFYVTDLTGQKILNAIKQKKIINRLLNVLGSDTQKLLEKKSNKNAKRGRA